MVKVQAFTKSAKNVLDNILKNKVNLEENVRKNFNFGFRAFLFRFLIAILN